MIKNGPVDFGDCNYNNHINSVFSLNNLYESIEIQRSSTWLNFHQPKSEHIGI